MHLRVNVVLVQLNVAVTDSKGNYVTGLRPEDFSVSEDKIPQKVSTFEESSESRHSNMGARQDNPSKESSKSPAASSGDVKDPADVTISHLSEDNVFILF